MAMAQCVRLGPRLQSWDAAGASERNSPPLLHNQVVDELQIQARVVPVLELEHWALRQAADRLRDLRQQNERLQVWQRLGI
jgi:hypothetical protein